MWEAGADVVRATSENRPTFPLGNPWLLLPCRSRVQQMVACGCLSQCMRCVAAPGEHSVGTTVLQLQPMVTPSSCCRFATRQLICCWSPGSIRDALHTTCTRTEDIVLPACVTVHTPGALHTPPYNCCVPCPQIYNENIQELLAPAGPQGQRPCLKLKEDKSGHMCVVGAQQVCSEAQDRTALACCVCYR
jgi:hypothetical protein